MEDRFNFRIWKKREKQMVNGVTNLNPLLLDKSLNKDADNYVIMQCTGLKDKNGKLIYEGDIVKIANGSIHGEILCQDRPIKWIGLRWNIPLFFKDDSYNDTHYMNVIGNVYENPELLE